MKWTLPALLALTTACAHVSDDRPVASPGPLQGSLPTSCPTELDGVDVDLASTSTGYEVILATEDAGRLPALRRLAPRLARDYARAYGLQDRMTFQVTDVMDDDDFEIDLPDLGLDLPAAPVDRRLIPEGVLLVITPVRDVDLGTIRTFGHSFGDWLEDHCGAGV